MLKSMTTFKQFLLEDDPDSNPDLSGFKKNAKIMLEEQIFLYRGTRTARHHLKLGTFTGFIASERTIDRVPKGSKVQARLSVNWEVPKRSISYFVTRDASHASDFGDLMFVIPADDISLYAWSAYDFNQGTTNSYQHQVETLEDYTTDMLFFRHSVPPIPVLVAAAKLAGIGGDDKLPPDDPKAIQYVDYIIGKVDDIEDMVSDDPDNWRAEKLLGMVSKIIVAISKANAKTAGDVYANATAKTFKIKTFTNLADIPKKLKGPDELWFNGKFLAINLSSRHTADKYAEQALNLILGT